jgi:hypothetical protein
LSFSLRGDLALQEAELLSHQQRELAAILQQLDALLQLVFLLLRQRDGFTQNLSLLKAETEELWAKQIRAGLSSGLRISLICLGARSLISKDMRPEAIGSSGSCLDSVVSLPGSHSVGSAAGSSGEDGLVAFDGSSGFSLLSKVLHS